MSAAKSGYSASNIKVLEGLDPVRKRPGMYIGTTGIDGLYLLIKEVFDNSRDEAMGNFADEIEIVLLPDNYVRVSDNGRGIPVDIHPKTKVSALETIMTTLHAGGKFGDGGYKVSGGLHGVGVSAVNALSEEVIVYVHKDGDIYTQEYNYGKTKAKVKKLDKTKKSGTVVIFKADKGIFKEINFEKDIFDLQRIISETRDQSYLVGKMRVRIIDARQSKGLQKETDLFLEDILKNKNSYSLYFEGGLKSFIKHHSNEQKSIQNKIFYVENTVGNCDVAVAFQYVDDISSRIFAFGNNIRNQEGGTHLTGFKTALTRTINSYAKAKKLLKDSDLFTGDDVLEGLTAVVSIKLPEIQFEGQTKSKLGSVEARGAVESTLNQSLGEFLEENPQVAKQIIAKITLALQARKAAKAAKDNILRKGAFEGFTLPGKLADCQTKSKEEAELFIVEGDSAGGTAKSGRDRRTQAILPLKGKILNVEKARIDKVIVFEEIKNIVIALGTAIGDTLNLDKLRYGKIIIATDADVDGAHIRTLLLTLFYRFFRPLVDNGHIYFAQPPLFRVSRGKESYYVYSEEERDDAIKKLQKGDKEKNIAVQRYKGLGEMNSDELWETTMDPEKRTLKKVVIEDVEEADRIFDILMGQNVSPRKEFITKNAKYAEVDL